MVYPWYAATKATNWLSMFWRMWLSAWTHRRLHTILVFNVVSDTRNPICTLLSLLHFQTHCYIVLSKVIGSLIHCLILHKLVTLKNLRFYISIQKGRRYLRRRNWPLISSLPQLLFSVINGCGIQGVILIMWAIVGNKELCQCLYLITGLDKTKMNLQLWQLWQCW